MHTRKIIALAALIGTLCSGSYVLSQNTKTEADKFTDAHLAAEGDSDKIDALMDAYAKMPNSPDVVRRATRLAFGASKRGDNGPAFAALISQNQKMIEQNARIIALLEKQAAQKKP